LAMWPDFACPGADAKGRAYFEHYFYYTSDTGQIQVEFQPIGENILSRAIPEKGRTWYLSKTPLSGFVGSIKGKHGLLLINYTPVKAPTRFWKVGVDFGSTHTTVFYREVDQHSEGEWSGVQG